MLGKTGPGTPDRLEVTRLMQLAEMADDGMSKVWPGVAGGLDCAVIVIAMAPAPSRCHAASLGTGWGACGVGTQPD